MSILELFLKDTDLRRVQSLTDVSVTGQLAAKGRLAAPISGLKAPAFLVEYGVSYQEAIGSGEDRRYITVFHPVRSEVLAGSFSIETTHGRVEVPKGTELSLEFPGVTAESAMAITFTVPGDLRRALDDEVRRRDGTASYRELALSNGDRVELRGPVEPSGSGGWRVAGPVTLRDLSLGGLPHAQARARHVLMIAAIVAGLIFMLVLGYLVDER